MGLGAQLPTVDLVLDEGLSRKIPDEFSWSKTSALLRYATLRQSPPRFWCKGQHSGWHHQFGGLTTANTIVWGYFCPGISLADTITPITRLRYRRDLTTIADGAGLGARVKADTT